MVIFVAKQKVKGSAFKELDLLATGKISKEGPNGFTASESKFKVKVTGGDFEYTKVLKFLVPIDGTIESLKVFFKGPLAYKVTGLSLPIEDAASFDSVDDALETIFVGDDVLKGSPKNDTLRGFDGNDNIKGKNGNDKLDGGEGNNTLNGGPGKDQYLFKAEVGTFMNKITKFEDGDKVKLLKVMFDGIGTKSTGLDDGVFHEGPTATAANQRLIYDKDSGEFSYDPDGNGIAAQTKIAQFKPGTDFDEGNIFIV